MKPGRRHCVLKCSPAGCLFAFPDEKKDGKRRMEWLRRLGVKGPVNKRIYACHRHFSAYMRTSRCLERNAVPDLNLRGDYKASQCGSVASSDVHASYLDSAVYMLVDSSQESQASDNGKHDTLQNPQTQHTDPKTSDENFVELYSQFCQIDHSYSQKPPIFENISGIDREVPEILDAVSEESPCASHPTDAASTNIAIDPDVDDILDVVGMGSNKRGCYVPSDYEDCTQISSNAVATHSTDMKPVLAVEASKDWRINASQNKAQIRVVAPNVNNASSNTDDFPRNYKKERLMGFDGTSVQTSSYLTQGSPRKKELREQIIDLKRQIREQNREIRKLNRESNKLAHKLAVLNRKTDKQLTLEFCRKLPLNLAKCVFRKLEKYNNRHAVAISTKVDSESVDLIEQNWDSLHENYEEPNLYDDHIIADDDLDLITS